MREFLVNYLIRPILIGLILSLLALLLVCVGTYINVITGSMIWAIFITSYVVGVLAIWAVGNDDEFV